MWHLVAVGLAAYLGAGLFFVLREAGDLGDLAGRLAYWPGLLAVAVAWLPIAVTNVVSAQAKQGSYGTYRLPRGYLAAPAALWLVVLLAGIA